ncbi:glycosyltransferase family 4 protein [Micromonospora sp. NPDC051296]|uniref:glycosyltransferase family 4 protein n=1 Tax=Micromonospora sp. NPDC051296 TaxID=3155046 RepID=UPI003447F970
MAAERAWADERAGTTDTRTARRPHVAIAVVNLPAERDRRVIRECLALESAGYRVTVICPRGQTRLRYLPGSRDTAIRSFRQPFAGDGILSFAAEFAWAFLWVAWHLAVLVVRHRVVAAQVCNPPDVFWPLALVMRAIGRGWIFDHHDLSPELYACKTAAPRPAVTRLLTWFERLSMRFASEVVATNESYRQIALTRGGCAPERVTIVRNGPAAGEIAAPTDADPRTGDKQIVYVGVINEQDHVDRAVLAADRLAALRGRDGWEMVIAGDGECLPALRTMVDERGLSDVVRFTGWLQAPEVDALLRGATLGIQPDIFSDMTNLSTMAKTVEYMARGLPVVAVDLLETQRTAGEAGRYVATGSADEFAKALDELLDDERQLAQMRAIARERFTSLLAWEHQAAAYLRVWRRVVPLPDGAAPAQATDRPEPAASPEHAS